jgi:hypothetical protein
VHEHDRRARHRTGGAEAKQRRAERRIEEYRKVRRQRVADRTVGVGARGRQADAGGEQQARGGAGERLHAVLLREEPSNVLSP